MPKLHLKPTPEEEAARRFRKERKKEKKRKHHSEKSSAGKRRRYDGSEGPKYKWASSDEDGEQDGPQPSSSKTKLNDSRKDGLAAELEDQYFREKMFDALGDDERLDSIEAQLNDYAHVPDRWRAGGSKFRGGYYDDESWDEFTKMDPRHMDDEEYAEWIRMGMYRRTHAQEYAEQQRKKAEYTAKIASEKARWAATTRLEKLAEEERRQRKHAKEARRRDHARAEYERRWKALLEVASGGDPGGSTETLTFTDIPWPVFAASGERYPNTNIDSSELTAETISSFLLDSLPGSTEEKRDRKDRLRETILRYHPDKFEGRFMHHIVKRDREKVRDGIGEVVRALNTLLAGN